MNIDCLRMERRFCLPEFRVPDLIKILLSMGLIEQNFSEHHITQTIYWLDDLHYWALGTSLKSRRYLPRHSESVSLGELEGYPCKFEIKREIPGTEQRRKDKIDFPDLRANATFLSSRFKNVRPYLLVEYRRRHFVLPNSDLRLRVTVDTDIRFWYFRKGVDQAIRIGEDHESAARLELKIDRRFEKSPAVYELLVRLDTLSIQKTDSKKKAGLNMLKFMADELCNVPLLNELPDCEIEAKLDVPQPLDPQHPLNPPSFFHRLRKFSLEKVWPTDPRLPYVQTTSSVNHYWMRRNQGGQAVEAVKILTREMTGRPTLKSDLVVVDPGLGILERTEIKGKKFLLHEVPQEEMVKTLGLGELEYAGNIARSRKMFWIWNRATGRSYHVSLDRCYTHGRPTWYQIEIEYEGRHPEYANASIFDKEATRLEIIEDIRFLAWNIVSFAHKDRGIILTPGLEKFKWLVG
jgi:hypothetical protein